MKNKNILITGADGFIGSHLCERLVKKGANVKALVLYNSFETIGWLNDLPKNVLDSIEIISGDIRDNNFMINITRNIDIVFHLAALIAIPYSYNAPRSYVETNVIGTLNVLEAARLNSCNRIINTSTSEVYGSAIYTPIDEKHPLQAQSPYAASKISADHIAESFFKTYNSPVINLRPFNTFGPRQSERAVIPTIIRQMIDPKCKTILIGDTSPKRDFNYVTDTVDAYEKIALIQDNKIQYGTAYNAGSGRAISIKETIEIINQLTNNNKPIIKQKNRYRPKKSEVNHLLAESTKLKSISDWKPKVSFNKGIEKTIKWWQKKLLNNEIRHSISYSK